MSFKNAVFVITGIFALQTAYAGKDNESVSAEFADKPTRKIALIVQNHAAPGGQIPMVALTDALTAKFSGRGFRVINPYNAYGKNLNRTVVGEKLPETAAIEIAKKLKADGAVMASVLELLDSTSGTPVFFHQYSIRISLSLVDAQTGAAVCGETIKVRSPKYTNNQVKQNKLEYLGDLMYAAADECAEKLEQNPAVKDWKPSAPPAPSPAPPALPSVGALTLFDIDSAVQKLIVKMRMNSVFRTNYDKAQSAIGRLPLAIVAGIVDMTKGRSASGNLSDLLAAGSQGVRMTLVNSGLFEAKDDTLVTTISDRIIKSGNSPLEDGELMSALKQHGSPDFYVVGDMMYFSEGRLDKYRIRLALHNLHTGKIVFEDVYTIEKRKSVNGGRSKKQ